MAIAEAAAQLLQQSSTEISAAEVAAEIERNYATMAQLKDDRIARLEEMLAHAHATLEHGENNRGDVLEYSETRRLKAELARRDEVELRLLERIKECDMEGAAEAEERIAFMTEATENMQAHFRDETLKMCQEITELKMTVRRLEVDLIREKEKTAAVVDSAAQDAAGYETRIFQVTETLEAEQDLNSKLKEAVQWEREARNGEAKESHRLRELLKESRKREEELLERCQLLDHQTDHRRNVQTELAHAEEAHRKLHGDVRDLNRRVEDRERAIDLLEQAAVSREHDFNALRKRFAWLQEEHRRVILEAEQMQLNLEADKAGLQRTIRAREAAIDTQEQDKLARMAELDQERRDWHDRLLSRERVEQLEARLAEQTAALQTREHDMEARMAEKEEQIKLLRASATRQYDIQEQSALAAQAEFAEARARWQERLQLQDQCIEENTMLRKELARVRDSLTGNLHNYPAAALLSQSGSGAGAGGQREQEAAHSAADNEGGSANSDELEALMLSTRLQAVQNLPDSSSSAHEPQDPRLGMEASDWDPGSTLGLGNLEQETEREFEGLEQERDRVRRHQAGSVM